MGTVLIVVGALALAYGATIYLWRDPVTDLYARWKQSQLTDQLADHFEDVRSELALPALEPEQSPGPETPAGDVEPGPEPAAGETTPGERSPEELAELVTLAARRMYERLEEGEPLGRIRVPRLGIDPVFVNGTRWGDDLSRGPGRYPETFLPGMGRLTAIAGHRTTFGAPFRHIDDLEPGDPIELELAYGTFRYEVVEHEIVDDEDWSVIGDRGYDALVLSACHPLYSASQRWIVYARLVQVTLPDGSGYAVEDAALAAGVS